MIQIYGRGICLFPIIRRAAGPLLAVILAFGPIAAFAQATEDLFRGTWQIQTPDQGTLVLLLKNEGIASYFWGDNADRSVYPGRWTHNEASATINWADGSSHQIERTNSGFVATFRGTSGTSNYNSPAMQLPKEILGQWAKPPTPADALRSDRDEAKGYFGIWKLAEADYFLFVEPDRSAASNRGEDGGQRGQWAKQGSELHIIWDSGAYGILSEAERGFTYREVESGQVIEDDRSGSVGVTRTLDAAVPSSWLANYREELESDSEGIAFPSRKVARNFYRGDWLVRREVNTYARIELSRFGGLKTSEDRSLSGQWTLSGQDVFMRWDDGMRQILSPVGRGFVLYEYSPGRPLDGVPTRIFPAAPADTAKLAEHLKDRQDIAGQMQAMAEAAGIDPASQEDVGWGRSFGRWIWPFGKQSEDASAQEMLSEEFADEEARDPWWWPFWSESAKQSSDSTDNSPSDAPDPERADTPTENERPLPQDMAEVETGPESESTSAEDKEIDETPQTTPVTPKRRNTKNWAWPF